MEHMDVHQTPNLGEHKNLKSHARDHLESVSSAKRAKYNLRLPTLKKAYMDDTIINLCNIFDLSRENYYYKGIITRCENEISACEKAFKTVKEFFDINFQDLKEKDHDFQRISDLRQFVQSQELILQRLRYHFPLFKKFVVQFCEDRVIPLSSLLHQMQIDYSNKFNKFAKESNIEKIRKLLDKLVNSEEFVEKELMDKNGLTEADLSEIMDYLEGAIKVDSMDYVKEDVMNEEQDDASDTDDIWSMCKEIMAGVDDMALRYTSAKRSFIEQTKKSTEVTEFVAPIVSHLQMFEYALWSLYGLF